MLMDRQTEDSDFSGPSVGHGSKKVISGTEECHSVWEGKKNRKLNPFMKTMLYRSNIHYSKINQKKKLKKATTNWNYKTWDLLGTQSSSPLGKEVRYFRYRYSIKLFHA